MKQLYIIGVVADREDGWEIKANEDGKSIPFMIALETKKLSKKDTMFINNNIKAFAKKPDVYAKS